MLNNILVEKIQGPFYFHFVAIDNQFLTLRIVRMSKPSKLVRHLGWSVGIPETVLRGELKNRFIQVNGSVVLKRTFES